MNKKKIALGAGVGIAVLLGGGYVVSYFVAGNQVPAKAAVDGVAIGGLTPTEATEKLKTELSAREADPLKLSAGEVSVQLDPAESGLSVNYEATVAAAGGGFSWNPLHILNTLTGGSEVALVREVDQEQLTEAVGKVAPSFAREAVDATLAFTDAQVARTEAVDAQALKVPETVETVAQIFKDGKREASAAVTTSSPAVTDAMVDEAITSYAQPLLSGPVTLTSNGKSMQITPATLAEVTTFKASGDKLTPVFDGEALYKATTESRKELGVIDAKDASFELSGNGVVVVPAVAGKSVTPETLVKAVEKVAFAAADARTTQVEVSDQNPEFTTEMANDLGTFEVIGEYTTYYPPGSAYRNTNLGTATAKINGTVLMPDEIFSMNNILGPRTAANGYVEGYVIDSGRLVKSYGGGISQSATTLFNAMFLAGYKDIEHQPHTLYFSRYPAGREATVNYGSIDLKFQNDSKYPAVIQAYISPASESSQGSVTFRIWSKRTYDKVVAPDPVKSDFYSGTDRVVNAPDCEPQNPIEGFTATYQRIFYQNGAEVKRENYSWKYHAGDRITCETQ